MQFNSKKVLITGGASGIGKLMGELALQKGAELVIWDINENALHQTAEEFSELGTVHTYLCDISNPEEIKNVAKRTKIEVGIIDVLINNAGIVVGKYFDEHSESDIFKTMQINALAPMLIIREFLPDMISQDSGHVCNITSSAGLISNPKMSVYVASKWACTGFSDSLRIEMKRHKRNIGVTTVTPFYINTGMFDGVKSIVPVLKPKKVAQKIILGIERNKIYVSMPWSVRFVRLGQAIMPQWLFDKVIGEWVGIYNTMNEFKGRR